MAFTAMLRWSEPNGSVHSRRNLRSPRACVKEKLNRPVQFSVDETASRAHMQFMPAPLATAEISPKRHAVVAAAARLFKAHGYGQVSMDSVAKEAGVSKATLYAYFESKDQLFASIIAGACGSMAFEEGLFAGTPGDIRADLTRIGGRLLRFLLDPDTQAIQRVVISESDRFPELGAAFLRAGPEVFLGRLAEWIRGQVQHGRLHAPDARLAADQFGALLRPLIFLRALLKVPPVPDEAEIEATVAAAVDTFLRAYAAD
jgi:TetR/AcrR family transcriptional repressor of mexJK operon